MSSNSGGGFGSFKDLARSLGKSVDDDAEKAEERGWTLERDEPEGAEDGEELPDLEITDAVRQRVARRPEAFGPMDHGPPPYRKEPSDELELLRSFQVRTRFPDDVMSEVAALGEDPTEEDMAGRLDLRGRRIFTIDGEDAKDFDDAISIEELEGGGFELGVHIADVSHYVRPGTMLDEEALARATSVYLADTAVPMLPDELCNRLCSLVEGRPRLTYSVFMTWDAKGARTAKRVERSVIQSVRRTTYRQVQELLDGKETPGAQAIADLEPDLRAFSAWTRRQQAIRDAKESLRMQSPERKFLFDEAGEVTGITRSAVYFSQTLIEETAIAANQAVGDLFKEKGLPMIYRVHPERDEEEINALRKTLAKYNIRVPKKDRLTGRDIGRLISVARRRPNAEALIQRIMGLVDRATYEVGDPEDVARHFGLAREFYLHFTSPIRRYPDLIVHRFLGELQEGGEEAARERLTGELVLNLKDTAVHCSIRSEIAEAVERSVENLKICQYMEPHVGEKLEAKVQQIFGWGLVILLTDYDVQGVIKMKALGERPKINGPHLTVWSGRRPLSFTEGQPTQVRIKAVDFIQLEIELELA